MGRSTEAANARLLSVQSAPGEQGGGGSSDVYETGEPAPGPVDPGDDSTWEIPDGGAGCWYEERRQRTIAGGQRDVVIWRTLVVSADLDVDWSEGDTVTFRTDGPPAAIANGRVEAIEATPPPAGQTGEVLLTLEPA